MREIFMSIKTRDAIRIILLNNVGQLLLMCVENLDITTAGGDRNKRFWCTIGGGIESGESIMHAAVREIYEETGIAQHDVILGSLVWVNEVDLVFKGVSTRFKEKFIVAHTHKNNVALHEPTEDEKQTVTRLQWFSIDDIKNSPDVIFPVGLAQYLPAVIAGDYPEKPIDISVKI